jgi:solute carrier family 35 protein E3
MAPRTLPWHSGLLTRLLPPAPALPQKNGLTSNELLLYVAPTQAATLLLLGPSLDKLVGGTWVFEYQWNVPAINAIAISCALAVGVNITQFLCLGRFSALSFQAS